ncbi:hypothetical protein AMTRI_Chr02g220440 [Amborella trichopoda]|uniref:Uncharacterized protein n=1 Tax=Amborella trichopoda TaxID=13333 RepID=W1P5M9_AMBTC|nr:hypothetical protein AMTR_s00003p00157400 [Amborella trichopoda]
MEKMGFRILQIIPCRGKKSLRTNSHKGIGEMMKGGLDTINEEEELSVPSPRPKPAASPLRSRRRVKIKLKKKLEGGWQMRVTKIGARVGHQVANIGDSYVQLMNGFSRQRGIGSLGRPY